MKYAKNLFIVVFIAFLLTLICFPAVSASYRVSNYSINNKYSYEGLVSGWINLSFSNEPSNSLFSLLGQKITVKEFLDNSKADYSCSTSDCEKQYLELSDNAREFSLNNGESKIIGLKIVKDSVGLLKNFKLNITSNAPEFCNNQLSIDILNDKLVDWKNNKASASNCGNKYSGCFDSSSNSLIGSEMENDEQYCNTFSIEQTIGLNAIAKLSGNGNAKFKFSLDGSDECEQEINNLPASGEISCVINTTIDEPRNITLCLEKISGNGLYKLYIENTKPVCGFFGTESADFSLFIQKKNYAPIREVIINSSENNIEGIISEYISSNYDNNCTLGCYIPMNITSYVNNQNIKINTYSLAYSGGLYSSNIPYSLQIAPSNITLPYTKIELSNLNFKVSNSPGLYDLSIKLNGVEIAKKSIEVLSLANIGDLVNKNIPVAVNYPIEVAISGRNITKYTWFFGDNTSAQSQTNRVLHKYEIIGNYVLTLSVSNINGEINKSFDINAVNPGEYLNASIAGYIKNMTYLKNQINNFSVPVKNALINKFEFDKKEEEINKLKAKFEAAGGSSEVYAEIISTLENLALPSSIKKEQKISGKYIFSPSKINVANLKTISSETTSASDEKVKNAVFGWAIKSLEVNQNIESYPLAYADSYNASFTNIKLNIKSKSDFDRLYLIIDKPKEEVYIENYEVISLDSDSSGVELSFSGEEEKEVNIMVYDSINLVSLPVYMSPKLSLLAIPNESITNCNNDEICDSENGENYDNCSSDCSPSNLKTIIILLSIGAIIFLIIILFVFFKDKLKKKEPGKGDRNIRPFPPRPGMPPSSFMKRPLLLKKPELQMQRPQLRPIPRPISNVQRVPLMQNKQQNINKP